MIYAVTEIDDPDDPFGSKRTTLFDGAVDAATFFSARLSHWDVPEKMHPTIHLCGIYVSKQVTLVIVQASYDMTRPKCFLCGYPMDRLACTREGCANSH